MHSDTVQYNKALAAPDREICEILAKEIDRGLPEAENKVWHAIPVWFLDGNPVVTGPDSNRCQGALRTGVRFAHARRWLG